MHRRTVKNSFNKQSGGFFGKLCCSKINLTRFLLSLNVLPGLKHTERYLLCSPRPLRLSRGGKERERSYAHAYFRHCCSDKSHDQGSLSRECAALQRGSLATALHKELTNQIAFPVCCIAGSLQHIPLTAFL